MAVIRGDDGDAQYVKIRNTTARDSRLSYEARGMLVQILSHDKGWKIREKQLMDAGSTGRDRVRRMLQELADHGYAEKTRTRRVDGTWGEVDWTVYGHPMSSTYWKSGDGSPVTGQPPPDNPTLKKNNREEEQYKNVESDGFDDWWRVYPNKQGKKVAKDKWRKLTPEERSLALGDTLARIAGDRQWKEGFVPHGSTYINQRRWEDDWRSAPKREASPSNHRFPPDYIDPDHPPKRGETTEQYHARLRGLMSRE